MSRDIARRVNKTIEEVMKTLIYLKKIDVIEYLPQTDKPQILFLQERINEKDLILRDDVYANRKERFKKRLDSMISYVSNEHQCRSVMLLNYFNETQLYRCGICDYCRKRNKVELNDVEFEALMADVKLLLQPKPLSITELVRLLNRKSEEKTLNAIQWMIDNEILNR